MTTTPETPAIASTHPTTRDGAGKPKAPSALEVDHHRGPEVDDPIEGIRAVLHRSERQELVSRELAGVSPARVALLAPVDRSERDAITHGSAEHGDGIDLGW